LKVTAADLPGRIRPVAKPPPFWVAVWVVLSWLVKTTRVPALTVNGVGWKEKLAIRSLAARLAIALWSVAD
jgi:hypothetical protein